LKKSERMRCLVKLCFVNTTFHEQICFCHQPSEIFGFDTVYTCSIFGPVYNSTKTMERSLWNVHQRLRTEAYVLPPLGLGGRMIPRADGTILKQL
jgi:hypothetical protein